MFQFGIGQTKNKQKQVHYFGQIQHKVNDLENCYICPLLAFSHLGYNEVGYEEEMALCEDLLVLCEKLIVASDLSDGVEREIDLAEKCDMEIEYLEDTE